MKRKSFATIIISLVMCGILAGCGQSGAADTTAQTKEEETTEEAKPEKKAEEAVENEPEKKAEFDTAAAEKSLKEMSDALSGFMWASMMKEAQYSPLEAGDIKLELTDEEKIRAAALACEPDGVIDSTFVLGMGGFSEDKSVGAGPDDDGFHGVSVSEKDVEKNCLDLFGTKADWGELPPGPVCDLYDAVLYRTENESCALIIDKEIETETSFENHECTVTEEDGRYIGKVNFFWGYWGELELKPGYSNFEATYELEQNDESKYGMAIRSISIKKTAEKETRSDYEKMYEPVFDEVSEVLKNGLDYDRQYDYISDGLMERVMYPGKEDLLDDVGYILDDISGDGIPELIIGYNDAFDVEEIKRSYVLSVFTLSDDKPYTAFSGWARNRYWPLPGGHFYNSGSSGASNTEFGENHLSKDGTAVIWDDFYFSEEEASGGLVFFHNTSGIWDRSESEKMDISERDFWRLMDGYEERCVLFSWTPMREYTGH